MANPVPVLRLPHGPSGSGKGFDPDSARFRALHRSTASTHGTAASSSSHSSISRQEQAARAQLRERFLLGVRAACGRPARFRVASRAACLPAELRACDLELLTVLVAGLDTPLGVQESALLRARDILYFSCTLPAAPGRGEPGRVKVERDGLWEA